MADDNAASTETTEVETPTAETTETANETAKAPGDVPPEVKRALAKANKEAETLRLRLKEFEDRDKSEAEKLTERVDAAERHAVEMEAAALRLEVAAEKGLSPAQAKRLVGTTRDELEADADELLTTFKPAEQADDSAAITGALDLGTRGTATAAGDPAADFAKFLKRELA